MRRNLLLSSLGGALALGLFASSAGALPASSVLVGKIGAETAGAVEQVHWRWHNRNHFFFPRVYGYYYNPYRSYSYSPYYSYRYSYGRRYCPPRYYGYGYGY